MKKLRNKIKESGKFLKELRNKPEREKRALSFILILIFTIIIIFIGYLSLKSNIVEIPKIEKEISQIEEKNFNETILIFKKGIENIGKIIFNSLTILGEKISLFLTKIFSFFLKSLNQLFFYTKEIIEIVKQIISSLFSSFQ